MKMIKIIFLLMTFPLIFFASEHNWEKGFSFKFLSSDNVEIAMQSDVIRQLPALESHVNSQEKEPVPFHWPVATENNLKKLIFLIQAISTIKVQTTASITNYINNKISWDAQTLFDVIYLTDLLGYDLKVQNILIGKLLTTNNAVQPFEEILKNEKHSVFSKSIFLKIIKNLLKDYEIQPPQCEQSINLETTTDLFRGCVPQNELDKIKNKTIKASCFHPEKDYFAAGFSFNGTIAICQLYVSLSHLKNEDYSSVEHLCFNKDGNYLAAVLKKNIRNKSGYAEERYTLSIWDVRAWELKGVEVIKEKPVFQHNFDLPITHITFGHQDTLVFSKKNQDEKPCMYVWTKNGQENKWAEKQAINLQNDISEIAASPSGNYIAYRDSVSYPLKSKIILCSLSDKKISKEYSVNGQYSQGLSIKRLCFDKNGRYLFFIDGYQYIHQIDMSNFQEKLIEYRDLDPRSNQNFDYNLGIHLKNNCIYANKKPNYDHIALWDIDSHIKITVSCGDDLKYSNFSFNAEGNCLITMKKTYLIVYKFFFPLSFSYRLQELTSRQLLYYIYHKLAGKNEVKEQYFDIYNSLPKKIKNSIEIPSYREKKGFPVQQNRQEPLPVIENNPINRNEIVENQPHELQPSINPEVLQQPPQQMNILEIDNDKEDIPDKPLNEHPLIEENRESKYKGKNLEPQKDAIKEFIQNYEQGKKQKPPTYQQLERSLQISQQDNRNLSRRFFEEQEKIKQLEETNKNFYYNPQYGVYHQLPQVSPEQHKDYFPELRPQQQPIQQVQPQLQVNPQHPHQNNAPQQPIPQLQPQPQLNPVENPHQNNALQQLNPPIQQVQQNQQRPPQQQPGFFSRIYSSAAQTLNSYKKWIAGGLVAGALGLSYYFLRKSPVQKKVGARV